MKISRFNISFCLAACIVGSISCSEDPLVHYIPDEPETPEVPDTPDNPVTPVDNHLIICDFETEDLGFRTNDKLEYSVIENPDKTAANPSEHCGKVVSAGAQWELIYSKERLLPFDFSKDGSTFTMKVNAPKRNGKVYFKLEGAGVDACEITNVTTTKNGTWETLTYDFHDRQLPDGKYNKIVLLFDAGETGSGETWLFDDIFQLKGPNDPEIKDDPNAVPEGMVSFCDFENNTLQFNINSSDLPMKYEIIENPFKEGCNLSDHVGHVVSGGHQWELLWSAQFENPLIFSKSTVFTMKVRSPKKNGKVYFKVEGPGMTAYEVTDVVVPNANEWTNLVFDFKKFDLPDGKYSNFVILFDAGETGADEDWYFDDIFGPDNTPAMLMRRLGTEPILTYGPTEPKWRMEHVANAAVMTPAESPDNNWRMYVRGSGYNDANEYHDQIGMFTQDASSFNPMARWNEEPQNPVIHHGVRGTCDELHLLDCAPVVGKDGVVYFYYQAVRGTLDAKLGSLAVRKSTDGGKTFSEGKMLKDGVGCSDAIYYNGKYYIFYGYGYDNGKLKVDCAVTENPESLDAAQVTTVLQPGGGPGNFDALSVNGTRIFRLDGIDKWFMVYQGSDKNFDYPARFHVAYSDDLLSWTKVDNSQPFFNRGEAGAWDQGAIWFGEVFEYDGTLYMYYEGWGNNSAVADRDTPYFSGGHSSTGCASVSKNTFLKWCGLK